MPRSINDFNQTLLNSLLLEDSDHEDYIALEEWEMKSNEDNLIDQNSIVITKDNFIPSIIEVINAFQYIDNSEKIGEKKVINVSKKQLKHTIETLVACYLFFLEVMNEFNAPEKIKLHSKEDSYFNALNYSPEDFFLAFFSSLFFKSSNIEDKETLLSKTEALNNLLHAGSKTPHFSHSSWLYPSGSLLPGALTSIISGVMLGSTPPKQDPNQKLFEDSFENFFKSHQQSFGIQKMPSLFLLNNNIFNCFQKFNEQWDRNFDTHTLNKITFEAPLEYKPLYYSLPTGMSFFGLSVAYRLYKDIKNYEVLRESRIKNGLYLAAYLMFIWPFILNVCILKNTIDLVINYLGEKRSACSSKASLYSLTFLCCVLHAALKPIDSVKLIYQKTKNKYGKTTAVIFGIMTVLFELALMFTLLYFAGPAIMLALAHTSPFFYLAKLPALSPIVSVVGGFLSKVLHALTIHFNFYVFFSQQSPQLALIPSITNAATMSMTTLPVTQVLTDRVHKKRKRKLSRLWSETDEAKEIKDQFTQAIDHNLEKILMPSSL